MIKNQSGKLLKAYIILGMIWAFLSLPGYAQPAFLPFVGQVTGDDVNIRSGENKNFEVVIQVGKGKELVVIGEKYDWFKVRLPDEASVFVSGQFLEPLRDGIAKVKGSKVNVRARPALKTGVVGKLRQGTLVKIMACQKDGWCQIEAAEGMYGWIHKDLVAKTSKHVPEPKRVALPTRNIYVLKREAEEQRKEEEAKRKAEEANLTVAVSGTVKSLADKAISQEVRHYIVSADGRTYLLKGYRDVLDGFLNQAVTLKGLPQDKTSLNYPVLLVTRITLAL